MRKFDEQKYNKAKEVAVRFFSKNRKLKTLSLGEITFNSDGFMHLIWRNADKKHKRDWISQIKRFHLLAYIKPVLQGMKYYQEYSESLEDIRIKKRGKPSIASKVVKYWGFVAVIDNKIRIKVLLRKIGEGNIHFWSIIPIWKTDEYKGIKLVRLYKGNPKED